MTVSYTSCVSVGNAELLRVWGKEGEMAMQFLHFSFAFGGVAGPLVTEPFLTPIPEDEKAGNASIAVASSLSNSSTIATTSPARSTMEMLNATESSTPPTVTTVPLTTVVHYAYIISGTLIFLVAIPLTVEFFRERSQKRRQDHEDEKEDVKQPLPRGLFLFVSFVLCFFYFVYCCVDDTFASFLATFLVKQLHWSKSRAAQASSVFWASFAVGRFLSIFAVRYISSVRLIILCCLALIVSMLGFLLSADHAVDAGVWVCTVVCSMSMGPIFPTGFMWMEAELVRVTGRMVSAILVASSVGTMVNPVLTAYLMQESTPMWFSYLLFAQSILCLLVFLFLVAIARLYVGKRYVIHEAKVQELNTPSLREKELAAGDTAM